MVSSSTIRKVTRNVNLHGVYILVLTLTLYIETGDWRRGQEPQLPLSLRSEYFPIHQETPEKLEFLSSILDLGFCFFVYCFSFRNLASCQLAAENSAIFGELGNG